MGNNNTPEVQSLTDWAEKHHAEWYVNIQITSSGAFTCGPFTIEEMTKVCEELKRDLPHVNYVWNCKPGPRIPWDQLKELNKCFADYIKQQETDLKATISAVIEAASVKPAKH